MALSGLTVMALAAVSTAAARAQQQPSLAVTPADATSPDALRLNAQINEAWRIDLVAEPAKAQEAFERIRIEAERLGLARQIGAALRGLAAVESGQQRSASAKTLLERALEQYRLVRDELGEARALRQLGAVYGVLGEHDKAMEDLHRARDAFARLGEKHDLAMTYSFLVDQTYGETRDGLIDEALTAARASGDRIIECEILHSQGDGLFTRGFYSEAWRSLSAALACYEETNSIAAKGRVLVSLGRVQRAHGQFERALALYQRAYALHQQVHDEPAALQSLNAIAVAYDYLGRYEDARRCYEEALTRARALGSERYIAFLTGNLGAAFANLQQYDKSLEMLGQAIALEKNPSTLCYRYKQKANVLADLGRLDEALVSVDQAVALSGEEGDLHVEALAARADITQRMNRLDASDADLREALRGIEEIRGKTLAQDIMKRGFSETTQEVFAAAIDVRSRRGDVRGALEIAEQARSRAFLDLLASRRPDSAVAGVVGSMHTNRAQNGPTGTDAVAPYMSASTAPDLESQRSTAAPTIDEMIATARRVGSTLLVYWVGERATIVWVVSPSGQIHSTTVKVDSTKLSELARSTTSPLKDNGAALALAGRSQMKPWRELYQILIKPVREHLPAARNSLLTIVPHGPLFQVSFAGLQDQEGKYLIESYRLHYTPSVGVLTFTAQSRHRLGGAAARGSAKALLVGDPTPAASDPGEESLTELPWARREVTEIGALLGAGHADVITEHEATEQKVREEIEHASLLHFATHGVIRQSESMSSFLALAHGKLTADEVYGLRLQADLVVLSACDTALGPMTGDGVIGFTRAFLYAGARSVIATEWNVPDRTGYELMRRFYRFRRVNSDPSEALRRAQISVLAALRQGTMRVGEGGEQVALRENPLYWAGFVLVGEP
jgi:CHAT domain-containing protein/tetratricopeptide (TPR) repeat protein